MTSWCMPQFSGETRAEPCPGPELLSSIRKRNTAAAALAFSDWLNEFQGFYCLWLSQTFVSRFTLLKEGVSQVPGGLFLFGQNSSDVFRHSIIAHLRCVIVKAEQWKRRWPVVKSARRHKP